MLFYKIRGAVVLFLTRILSAILFVEKVPIVSVAGLIEKDGKLLFLKLSYLKGLGLPGGIVHSTENIEAALRREIKEETNLSISELTYFTSTSAFFLGFPTLSIIFKLKTEGEMKDSKEGKLVWMKPEDAIGKMAYKNSEKALREYLGL